MNYIVDEALRTVISGQTMDAHLAAEFMNELMNGRVSSVQTAGLISVMAARGEHPSEIVGFARAMRHHSMKMVAPVNAIDTCGTGGDGADTFNISTTVAFVAAAAGVPVAKHGNRAASSRSGSADVLQELGAKIDLDSSSCERLLERTNLCFLFAQVFHPAMKHAAVTRKELGFRTIFNILGPLTNPAQTKRQVLGVFREDLVETVANALAELGVDHVLVVHGSGGLDELSISGPSKVAEVTGTHVRSYEILPEDFGLRRAEVGTLRGGHSADNALILRQVLQGERGPKRDVVLLNAGAAFYVSGTVDSIADGIAKARDIIDSGLAIAKVDEFVRESYRVIPRAEEVIGG